MTAAFPPLSPVVQMAGPEGVDKPGYYGVPHLKPPRWRWQIALYFFLEGISSGSYLLGTAADLFAHGRHPRMIRAARYLSLATLVPCPPLLIADLGRPERFHHMLRIVRWTSPMNTGAWALTAYGPFVAALAIGQYRPSAWLPARVTALAGLPFAFTMVAYPGVLLSTTSNPAWARTRFLGALFACSSVSSGAAALSLAVPGESQPLHRFERIAGAGEAVAAAAYVATAAGTRTRTFWLAVAGGILAPALLRRRSPRAASILTLGGALLLKWSITYGGRPAALDTESAHETASPNGSATGWRTSG